MAYICETVQLIDGVQYGITCVQHSYVPELTDEARDELLKWIIGCFAAVFAAKRVIRLFGG